MFYLVTPNGIHTGRTAQQVSKRAGTKIEAHEFRPCGVHLLAIITDPNDYMVRVDAHDLERFALNQMFKSSSLGISGLISVAILVLTLVLVFKS